MMSDHDRQAPTIIMADDDLDDCRLTQDAWEESGSTHQIRFVRDGEELLDYLHHRGKFSNAQDFPLPSMILLDLHMPKRNGHEVLKEMRAHEQLRHIPVLVFTHSLNEEDTCRTYALGANACMTKPHSTQEYQSLINTLSQYWASMVHLPSLPVHDEFFTPKRSWL